jgi:Cu(I)/Ag(I) efflux system membrane fusion protein
MKRTSARIATIAGAVGFLVVGMAGGYWWASRGIERDANRGLSAAAPAERAVLYWYDPMVPDQHFDRPGKSPFMDMQLVPKYADEAPAGSVRIDAGLQQSVGVRIAEVEFGALQATLRVPGSLRWDPRLEWTVDARVDALVTHVFVKAPYTPVRRGAPLVRLRAPGWVSALAESAALEGAESETARALRSAAQERLRILGIEGSIDRDDGSVTANAPDDGLVTEVLVREGQTVTAGVPLFRMNGIATLWLEAAVPQPLAGGVAPGARVEAHLDAFPGDVFHGTVEALLPDIDAATRTQRARIVLPNPDGRLAPGMFAEVVLHGESGAAMPLVPSEALILTGEDSRLILADEDGGFRPVRVLTGRSSGGRTEILSGLAGGERIVVSGQFLIDSEASLAGALGRLAPPGSPPRATDSHQHGTKSNTEVGPQ